MKVTYFPQASVIIQKVKEKLMDSLKGPRAFEDFHILHNNVLEIRLVHLCLSKTVAPDQHQVESTDQKCVLLKSSQLYEFSAC